MRNRIGALITRYREMLLYLFFGGMTTLINLALYFVMYEMLSCPNVPSTVIAWGVSVIFAFIVNKQFVFASKDWSARRMLREAGEFFGLRGATGLLDLAFMYVVVDLLGWNSTAMKMISNVVVTLLNYIAGKWMVFQSARIQNKGGIS